jgi:hypothetical protein
VGEKEKAAPAGEEPQSPPERPDLAKGSPTPHPGEPDVRATPSVNEQPDPDEVREGTAAPGVER